MQTDDTPTDDSITDLAVEPYLGDRDDPSGRWAIWAEANGPMRSAIREAALWLAGEHRDTLVRRYRLAELVKRLDDDQLEGRGRRYGSCAVSRLARFFGQDRHMVYAALRLAKAYTREEVECLSGVTLAGGRPLSYYHVELLSGLDTKAQRDEALLLVVGGGWTTDDLARHVHRERLPAKREGDGRGRPMAVPRDLDGLLRQQSRCAGDFLERSRRVWSAPDNGLLAKAHVLAPEERTAGRVQALLEHAVTLRRLAEEAARQADEAQRAYELVAGNQGEQPLVPQAA